MGPKDKKCCAKDCETEKECEEQFEGDEEEEVALYLYRLISKNKLSKRLSSFPLSEKRFKLSPSMVTSFKRELLIEISPSNRKRLRESSENFTSHSLTKLITSFKANIPFLMLISKKLENCSLLKNNKPNITISPIKKYLSSGSKYS